MQVSKAIVLSPHHVNFINGNKILQYWGTTRGTLLRSNGGFVYLLNYIFDSIVYICVFEFFILLFTI